MAESKFLKYQDKDGDRLIDVCKDKIDVKEQFVCPPCVPNPYATIPNWKELDIDEPFFNERNCTYQIAVVTKHTTTMDESLLERDDLTEEEEAEGTNARFDEYLEEAVEALLVNNSKDDSDPSKSIIRQSIEFTDFDLDPRPNSRLVLLYSVPSVEFETIEDADDEEDDEDEDEDEDSAGSTTVTYLADEISPKLIKARKALKLYTRYLKVFRAIKGGNILKLKNNGVFNLQNYGGSALSSILTDLDSFLNSKNLNIVGLGAPTFFKEKVTKLEFEFSAKYKLRKLRVWSAGCGDTPKIFGKKKLKSLNKKSSFKDPTALAYFAQLDAMETALTAREPQPWLEFVKEFTYPEVYDTFPQKKPKAPTGSCIAGALEKEGKQLGQDLLDETFSIGDALAYSFRKNICLNEVEDLEKEDIKLGLIFDQETPADKNAILAMATEQAFASLEQDDVSFDSLCAGILANFTGPKVGSLSLEDLWKGSLDKIKLCGLFDLALEATSCLMKGLTLEEAASGIIKAAIRGMSLENLGDFFLNVLPSDKQEEIRDLANSKLLNNDIFRDKSKAQAVSDMIEKGETSAVAESAPAPAAVIAAGETAAAIAAAAVSPSGYTPFGDSDKVAREKENMREGNQDVMVPSKTPSKDKTLAEQAQPGGQFDDSLIVEAYAAALVEIYADNILEPIEMLNKYPGAQMIASALAMLDCPQAPIMDPGIPSFIKSIELPYCNTPFNFVAPKFDNPFGWIPEIKDFPAIIFSLLKQAITQLIIKIIVQLMLKICNLLSSSACNALGSIGTLAASADDLVTGKEAFKDVIRQGICGDEADEEQLDKTIEDLFNSLGIGAEALANQERVNNFMSDLSSSVTQSELMSAFMGNPSSDMLRIVDNLIEYEYTEFREGLPNENAAADFFGNIGNLFPADLKDAIKDQLDNPSSALAPANPSLCATPKQLEDFCNMRQALLSDRATASQAAQMCENARDQMKNDLEDLSDLLQSGLPNYLESNMPPLISDPGCENGLVPFESEEAQGAATLALANELKRLKIAYATDMLGNGPGESRWGLINMIMSDTMGNPLTAHHRKEFFQPGYVDYHSDIDMSDLSFEDVLAGKFVPTKMQRGAYPAKVAEWLEYQLTGVEDTAAATDLRDSLIFSSNNEWLYPEASSVSFEILGLTSGLYDKPEIKLYELPSLGYNVKTMVDFQNDQLKFIRQGRKSSPDTTLVFRDNAKGLRLGSNSKDSAYSYGFDIELYMSDLREGIPEIRVLRGRSVATEQENIHNIYSDNVRILITQKNNPGAKYESPYAAISPIELPAIGTDDNKETEISERYYEFFAEDSTLEFLDLTDYAEFGESFLSQADYVPQVILLKEIIQNNGGSLDSEDVKTAHDQIMTSLLETFATEIGNNTAAFNYGATPDTLSEVDVEYVLGPGYRDSGLPYGEAEIEGEDEEGNKEYRKIRNDDMIMGMSQMQYQFEEGTYGGSDTENRVHYLDPSKFGGTYMNPPVYIAPLKNQGWMGLIDALFPELTHCKKGKKDLVNFDELEKLIDDRRPNIPIDERLKAGDSDCITELPYNRILTRDSAASLEGIITAAIRIFITTHIIKSLATFTKFKLDFPNVYSDIYAAYIVESMEKTLSGADSDDEERFGLFKDSEFWFAFLEQSVQMYIRRIDDGDIIEPPQRALRALTEINNKISNYGYPSKEDLKQAKELGDVKKIKTLKNYREEKNLNAIYHSKDLAKTVLKEMVVEQLNLMSPRLIENMKTIGMTPDINDMAYYLFQNLTQGTDLDLSEDAMIETSEELPTASDLEDQYTYGGEFSVYEVNTGDSQYSKGDEYIGYYHTHIDENGDLKYMAGEVHIPAGHDLLKPFATKMIVPIGDVASYGDSYENDNSKPFLIEKYIKINNIKYSPSEALDIILSNNGSLNISDIYPGTMEQVIDKFDQVVGVVGELGIRYGLSFSVVIDGQKAFLTSVELDALDTPISQFAPLEGNTKLLLCLLNVLKEDNVFSLVYRYIFPLNKLVSIFAIYNDMAFLPSIGQVTVEDNLAYGIDSEFDTKPGLGADVETDDDGNVTGITESSVDGWASLADRSLSLQTSTFFTHWDEWNQTLLTRSKIKIKRMLRKHYNYRNFKPGEFGLDFPKPGNIFLNNLRGQLKPPTGKKLLPWWKRRKLRTNPFDAKGNICEKE